MQLTTLSTLAATAAATALVGFAAGRAALPTAQEAAQEDPTMQAWIEAGTPGAPHRLLDPFVGNWTAAVEMWMAPGGEPLLSTGSMTSQWVLDGRFLEQRYTGDFGGMTFQGRGYWGYSNLERTYQGIWIDSGSTGVAYQAGYAEAEGQRFVMLGREIDPVTEAEVGVRNEIAIEGPDKHTYTRFVEVTGQESHMAMRITYTRAPQ
ncbi:MAG TPA: DUF1579 family protein [Planctomycetota bacterium]|nr:DUF1579 family protein [Planctomycetota bacterium]